MADPVRLRLLSLVAEAGELCSCNLEEPLGKSQPTISHHTKVLAEAGLIRGEKRGRWVWWRLVPERLRCGPELCWRRHRNGPPRRGEWRYSGIRAASASSIMVWSAGTSITILAKSAPNIANTVVGDVTVTVAVRRRVLKIAASPKKSPGPNSATVAACFVTVAVPDSITKKK